MYPIENSIQLFFLPEFKLLISKYKKGDKNVKLWKKNNNNLKYT